MATINVSPGLDTIQVGINAANNTSGDEVVLAAGTYTFSTWAMVFDSGITGTIFTGLTVRGATGNPDDVILDLSGVPQLDSTIYGGNATGVTVKALTLKNTPQGTTPILRDSVNSAYAGFTFDNIKIDNLTKVPFQLGLGGTVLGAGLTIKNITTTATFSGDYLIRIQTAATTARDLLIMGIDTMLNDGTMISAIDLTDISDVRIRDVKVYDPTTYGIKITSGVAVGCNDIDITNVYVEGNGCTGPCIHVGHSDPDNLHPTRRVRIRNAYVKNGGSYGIEFENDARDCELVGFRVYNCVNEGVALAEECQNIVVSDGHVDTVTGVNANGIAIVHGSRHRVLRNTIVNCPRGILVTEPGGFVVETIRNTIADNTIYNCPIGYYVNEGAMEQSAAESNMWCNNKVYNPVTAYAQVSGVNTSQASFESQFSMSIDKSDTVTSGDWSPYALSIQQALNILAGATGPYNYSDQHALNILAASGSPYGKSAQQALNEIVGK